MTDRQDDIFHSLGRLENAVETLVSANREANETRGRMFNRIEQVTSHIMEVKGRVDAIERDLNEVKPTVSEFMAWRNRVQGAGMLGRGLWVIGGFLLAVVAWIVTHFNSLIAIVTGR